jgi:hypothetical protein
MSAVKAFLSYRLDDADACRSFRRLRFADADIDFAVYPCAHYTTDWQTPCRTMIEQSDGIVVLIGATTADSLAVNWEIDVATRSGKHVLGVLIGHGPHRVPAALATATVLDWDAGRIGKEMESWSHTAQGRQPSAIAPAMNAPSP